MFSWSRLISHYTETPKTSPFHCLSPHGNQSESSQVIAVDQLNSWLSQPWHCMLLVKWQQGTLHARLLLVQCSVSVVVCRLASVACAAVEHGRVVVLFNGCVAAAAVRVSCAVPWISPTTEKRVSQSFVVLHWFRLILYYTIIPKTSPSIAFSPQQHPIRVVTGDCC